MNSVLEIFNDQQRRLFMETLQARNSALLEALSQQQEPTQYQRNEVMKLLSDEFSLNLDEASEPTARGKEIDILLGKFLSKWPLSRTSTDSITKIILLQAVEEGGLWEIVWELNTIHPSGNTTQHQKQAAKEVAEQIGRGWFNLFYSEEPGEVLTSLPQIEVARVLHDLRFWQEPRPGDISVHIKIAPAGEMAFWTMK